jgi:hypothetical protein
MADLFPDGGLEYGRLDTTLSSSLSPLGWK